MKQTFAFRLSALFLVETIGDFCWFPIWWYTIGLVRCVRRALTSLTRREQTLGVRFWIATLFQPMYGQTDIQSRVISFIFRILILVVRVALLASWMIVLIGGVIVYMIVPLFVVYGIWTSL